MLLTRPDLHSNSSLTPFLDRDTNGPHDSPAIDPTASPLRLSGRGSDSPSTLYGALPGTAVSISGTAVSISGIATSTPGISTKAAPSLSRPGIVGRPSGPLNPDVGSGRNVSLDAGTGSGGRSGISVGGRLASTPSGERQTSTSS